MNSEATELLAAEAQLDRLRPDCQRCCRPY